MAESQEAKPNTVGEGAKERYLAARENVTNGAKGALEGLRDSFSRKSGFFALIGNELGGKGKQENSKVPNTEQEDPVKEEDAPAVEVKGLEDFVDTYAEKLEEVSKQYGVSPELITAIVEKESTFNTNAVNKGSGATGFGQFVRNTWKGFERHKGRIDLNRKDPDLGLEAIAWLLSENAKELGRMGYPVDLKNPQNKDVEYLYLMHHSGGRGTKDILRALDGGEELERNSIPSTYREKFPTFRKYAEFVRDYTKGVQSAFTNIKKLNLFS